MRLALSTAMMALLAGCSSIEDPFLTSSVSSVGAIAPPLAAEVSPGYALAVLPAAIGAPRSVRQTQGAGEQSIRQVIVYGNDTRLHGENTLTVESGRAADGRFSRAPSQRALQAEMASALPGVPMRISPAIGENLYGVYGYATGPYGVGGACIYGWQLADTGGADGNRFMNRSYKAQIRLRFCDQRLSEERIPLLMRGMTLKAVNSATIDALRNAGSIGNQSASLPLYGGDNLYETPAAPQPQVAYTPSAEEYRPAPAPVKKPVQRASAPKPRVVAHQQPQQPQTAYSLYMQQPPQSGMMPTAQYAPVQQAPVQHAIVMPAPAVQQTVPQQAMPPRISNAAKVPLPGQKLVDTTTTGTVDTQSPDALEAIKLKAQNAWSVARAKMGGAPAAHQ